MLCGKDYHEILDEINIVYLYTEMIKNCNTLYFVTLLSFPVFYSYVFLLHPQTSPLGSKQSNGTTLLK